MNARSQLPSRTPTFTMNRAGIKLNIFYTFPSYRTIQIRRGADMKMEAGTELSRSVSSEEQLHTSCSGLQDLPEFAFFSTLFGTRVGVWQMELSTGLLRCDPVAAAMLGLHPYSPTPFELLPCSGEDLAKLAKISKSAGGSAKTFEFELRCEDSQGPERWLYILGRELDSNLAKAPQVAGIVTDISDRKSIDLALRESEATNRSIVSASTDCIKLLDLDGHLLFMNEYGARAMEVDDVTNLYGRTLQSFWPRSARGAIRRAIAKACQGGIGHFTGACPTLNGNTRWWDVVVSPVCDEAGRPIKLVAISRDISERQRSQESLLQAATCDALTGLPNRALFHSRLAAAIDDASELKGQVGLLLIDLDDFKQVNDTMGHDAGDALLTTLARRLEEFESDLIAVARLGGDEFAIIVTDLPNETALQMTANNILQRLRDPFTHANRLLDCHATIGAAIFPEHGDSPAEILKSADMALYVAKSTRRGSSLVFSPGYRAEFRKRGAMINRARKAVRERGIVPYYQPIVSLPSRKIWGFEALLRVNRPGRSNVLMPAAIMAAFEDPELAAAISNRMIGQVISDIRDWLDRGIPFGHVAVNASAADFRRDDFAEGIIEHLRCADIPTHHLQIEVTETVLLGRSGEYVERTLRQLSTEGVRIMLDDFGTGFASLIHLKQFPVDGIKIDKSFVHGLPDNPENSAIVEAVLNLGARLGLDVVAEGVETEQQVSNLGHFGCRLAQGFLFSHAIPACGVEAVLEGEWLPYQRECQLDSWEI